MLESRPSLLPLLPVRGCRLVTIQRYSLTHAYRVALLLGEKKSILSPNLKLRLAVSLSSDPGQRRNFEFDVIIWATHVKCVEGIDTDTDKLENHHPSTVEYEAPARHHALYSCSHLSPVEGAA